MGDTRSHEFWLTVVQFNGEPPVLVRSKTPLAWPFAGIGTVISLTLNVRLGPKTVSETLTVCVRGVALEEVIVICPEYEVGLRFVTFTETCNVAELEPEEGVTRSQDRSLVALQVTLPVPLITKLRSLGPGALPLLKEKPSLSGETLTVGAAACAGNQHRQQITASSIESGSPTCCAVRS